LDSVESNPSPHNAASSSPEVAVGVDSALALNSNASGPGALSLLRTSIHSFPGHSRNREDRDSLVLIRMVFDSDGPGPGLRDDVLFRLVHHAYLFHELIQPLDGPAIAPYKIMPLAWDQSPTSMANPSPDFWGPDYEAMCRWFVDLLRADGYQGGNIHSRARTMSKSFGRILIQGPARIAGQWQTRRRFFSAPSRLAGPGSNSALPEHPRHGLRGGVDDETIECGKESEWHAFSFAEAMEAADLTNDSLNIID